MKRLSSSTLRSPRLLWLPVAAGCVVAAGWWLAVESASPSSRNNLVDKVEERPSSRVAKLTAEEAVREWSPEARAAEGNAGTHPGITITGRPSPGRAEAFRKLLAQLRPGNAAELHHLLVEADEGGSGLADGEWRTLLEKWGRLDGAGASAYLGTQSDGARLVPGLLRGWAAIEPETAATWLDSHAFPPGQESWKAAAQRELVLGWFTADPKGAAEWLNRHNRDPGYDELAAAFAKQVASIDPENALEWVASMSGTAQQHAVQAVAREWLEQDEQAALKSLQAAGYTLDEIRTWEPDPNEGYDLLDPSHEDLPGIHFAEEP